MLLALLVVTIMSIAGTLYFFEIRRASQRETAASFVRYLQDSVNHKKAQMALRCRSQKDWPRMEALVLNDITEKGSVDADCLPHEIPNSQERKFLDGGEQLAIPVNPENGLSNLAECICADPCDPTCYNNAGFCYNRDTGTVWAQGIGRDCTRNDSKFSASSGPSDEEALPTEPLAP